MNKIKSMVTFALMSAPMLVMAAGAQVNDGSKGAGAMAQSIGNQASTATVMMVLISALLGIILLVMGGMNFKKYADNPNQTPLSKPIIFLAAGALLFGLSATSSTMQETLFGDDETDNGPADFDGEF